jgi:hypothetical protein
LFSVGECQQLPFRCLSFSLFSDVKMVIWHSFYHVQSHIAKHVLQQNADTSVFLPSDFWRVRALGGWADLIRDRPLLLSYTLPRSRGRFNIVKARVGWVIFLLTILHFRVTILRSGAGKGNPGLGRGRISICPYGPLDVVRLPTPFGVTRSLGREASGIYCNKFIVQETPVSISIHLKS